jgi:hypothetical protein
MDKKNRKIGQLTGKVLVFGGVYSNFKHSCLAGSDRPKRRNNPENCISNGIL